MLLPAGALPRLRLQMMELQTDGDELWSMPHAASCRARGTCIVGFHTRSWRSLLRLSNPVLCLSHTTSVTLRLCPISFRDTAPNCMSTMWMALSRLPQAKKRPHGDQSSLEPKFNSRCGVIGMTVQELSLSKNGSVCTKQEPRADAKATRVRHGDMRTQHSARILLLEASWATKGSEKLRRSHKHTLPSAQHVIKLLSERNSTPVRLRASEGKGW